MKKYRLTKTQWIEVEAENREAALSMLAVIPAEGWSADQSRMYVEEVKLTNEQTEKAKQYIGNCLSEYLINGIFGSVTGFAQQVEENGDEFEYEGVIVIYDAEKDIHHFWEKK